MTGPATVTARPIRTAWIGRISAGAVLVLFVVIALVMRHDSAGVHFVGSDQVGTAVIGVFLAGGFLLLARPRLVADLDSVRTRSYLGAYRTIPWDVVVDVRFPANARFARIVLPGEEILALYAVQRLDRDQAVEVMRGLRALLVAARERAQS